MSYKTLLKFLALFIVVSCSYKKTDDNVEAPSREYFFTANCKVLHDDRVKVELVPPQVGKPSIKFCFPKIVPGIYGQINFGKYVENLKAFDRENNLMKAERVDTNCWEILEADRLYKIVYEVNDGWEEFSYEPERFYRSAESTFTENEVFLINTNSLFGYIEGMQHEPFNIEISKPADLFTATNLEKISEGNDYVRLKAPDYRHLVDNPILISSPDTAHFNLDDVRITVAAYSTSPEKVSGDISREIGPLLKNQKVYLGGQLPVSEYTFIVYHNLNELEGHFVGDGLEHTSSTVILLNMPAEKSVICETVYGIASHEFFHTITPLAIHSEEIENYDFNDPEMSEHLWFYEGMTEYFTIHMPVKQGVQPVEDFLRVCKSKIFAMQKFDNSIPLTQLSKDVLHRQDEFYNFYIKGALTCMLLDIKLREWSNGKFGVQDLVSKLAKEYGKEKAFKDNEFFEKIVSLTDKSIGVFIDRYIRGGEPLPLKEYFLKTGIIYSDQPLDLHLVSDPTEQQLMLRRSWLNN